MIWPGQRVGSSAFRLALASIWMADARILIGSTNIADSRADCGAAFLGSADDGESTPVRLFFTGERLDADSAQTVRDHLIERIATVGAPRLDQ